MHVYIYMHYILHIHIYLYNIYIYIHIVAVIVELKSIKVVNSKNLQELIVSVNTIVF